MHEVFIGKNRYGRDKKYFVSKDKIEATEAARKTLRVSTDHIFRQYGYVVGNDLYLSDPMKNGQREVWVASFMA